MSYILEALKESQRTREEQRVPDIGTSHGNAEPEREARGRSYWPWALAALVVMAAGAGWWLAGLQGPVGMTPLAGQVETRATADEGAAARREIAATETKVPLPPDESTTIPQVEQKAAIEPTPLPAASEQAPAEVAGEPSNTGAEPVIDEPVKTVAKMVEQPSVDQASVTRLPEPTEPAPVVLAEQPVSEADDAPSVASAMEQAMEDIAVPATPSPKVATQENVQNEVAASVEALTQPDTDRGEVVEEEVPEERVPHYRELPFDVQRAVGDVKYSVHLYSPNPERRLVKINGLLYREGAEVSPGLVLEQVTPDGAIFTYREYRFWVPVR